MGELLHSLPDATDRLPGGCWPLSCNPESHFVMDEDCVWFIQGDSVSTIGDLGSKKKLKLQISRQVVLIRFWDSGTTQKLWEDIS
jgi:hypothetical protein